MNKQDTIYFKAENVFDEKWEMSNKEKATIFRVYSKIDETLFDVKNYNVMSKKLLSKGCLKNVKGKTPLLSQNEGVWFYYGDGDMGLNQIGNYRNGQKNGYWYIIYEDAIPEIFYYSNNISIDYNDSLKIFDDNKKLIAYGKGTRTNGIPKNKYFFLFYQSGIKSERLFIEKDNLIMVKYRNFDMKTNKILEKGFFTEEK